MRFTSSILTLFVAFSLPFSAFAETPEEGDGSILPAEETHSCSRPPCRPVVVEDDVAPLPPEPPKDEGSEQPAKQEHRNTSITITISGGNSPIKFWKKTGERKISVLETDGESQLDLACRDGKLYLQLLRKARAPKSFPEMTATMQQVRYDGIKKSTEVIPLGKIEAEPVKDGKGALNGYVRYTIPQALDDAAIKAMRNPMFKLKVKGGDTAIEEFFSTADYPMISTLQKKCSGNK